MMRGNGKGKRKGLAVAGLLFSILGALGFWLPILGTLLTVLGLVFSKLAMGLAKKDPRYGGQTFAFVGFVLSLIFFIASVITLMLVAGLFVLGFIAGKALG